MDYEKMTREELIEYIRECEKKRAFTYEDQMKLAFVDGSPFTLWASDRDCKIRFWAGECEELYGYKKEEVMGKDFVELFVAEDEKKAAREDQISIIDSGEIFHNIANDVGKRGNTLRLLTNCWRMKPPESDEYWNFEMGLIVDFYNQEVERLNQVISESKSRKDVVTRFEKSTNRYRAQCIEQSRYLNDAYLQCKAVAVKLKRRKEFDDRVAEVVENEKNVLVHIETLTEEYGKKIKACSTAEECERALQNFIFLCDQEMNVLKDAAICFQEISMEFEGVGNTEASKGTQISEIQAVLFGLQDRATNLINGIEHVISHYNVSLSSGKSTAPKPMLIMADMVRDILEHISSFEKETQQRIANAKNEEELSSIRKEVDNSLDEFSREISVQEKNFEKNRDDGSE